MASQTLTTTATVARVNLLPPEIADLARARKLKAGLVVGVAAAAVGVGMLYLQAVSSVSSAKAELATAQRTQVALEADLAKLQNVTDINAKVEARRALLRQAMGPEILWSRYLNDLSLTIPSDVWITKFHVEQQLEDAKAKTMAKTRSVFGADSVGLVEVEGIAFTHDDVAAWLESLDKQKGYVNPYFSRSELDDKTYNQDVYEFESSTQLTKDAHSGRYTKQAGSA